MSDHNLHLVVYARPEPQGSMRAFVVRGRPVVTSDNSKLRPYRNEVSRCAIQQVADRPLFPKHVPVVLEVAFYFRKPESVAKKRTRHVVKPDLSKLLRAVEDALTGIVYHDDAQIVEAHIGKYYDQVERTVILVKEATELNRELGKLA